MGKESIGDLRSIVSYFNAVKNEIAIDLIRYKSLNIEPHRYGYLPRPTIWISRLKSYRSLLPIFSFLWRWFFSYLFVLLNYMKFLWEFYKIKHKSIFDVGVEKEPIAIAFASRSIDVIDSLLLNEGMYYKWLVPSWVDGSRIKDESRVLHLCSLLELKDINKAFSLSMLSLSCFAKKMGPTWSVQLYTSFKWYLIYVVLLKNQSDLITAEHFDRFAVLVDSVIQRNKKRNHKLIMVQHGAVGSSSTNDQHTNFYIPTKLNCVSKFYSYDRQSEEFFKEYVFNRNLNKIEVSFYTSKLELSKIEVCDIPTVLFVGNAICEELHIHLLNSLSVKYKIKAFYKPHPTERIGSLVLKQNWIIIKEITFFPKVDFLISYPSTLTKEYGAYDIPSFIHPINLNVGLSQKYLNLLETELDILSFNKHTN